MPEQKLTPDEAKKFNEIMSMYCHYTGDPGTLPLETQLELLKKKSKRIIDIVK